jgi:2,3-diketo-5-methylthio-1-phosphopentane phosphatase
MDADSPAQTGLLSVTTPSAIALLNCSRMSRPRLYLLDVEGTIAPCSLTSDLLFPYARAHFESFLREGIAALEQKSGDLEPGELAADSLFHDIALLQAENHAEADPLAPRILPHRAPSFERTDSNPSEAIPDILAYVYWLMDHDSRSTALKSMQGKIWKSGFESGELTGTLFDDVPRALARWSDYASVAIYSAGSTQAQRVLLSHSIFGDLTPSIAAYFDTRTGPKNSSTSYTAIAAATQMEPRQVCFFSDSQGELDAARVAGLDTRLVCRPGNAPVLANDHVLIHSLDEVP